VNAEFLPINFGIWKSLAKLGNRLVSRVASGPFKVVKQGPGEVALDRDTVQVDGWKGGKGVFSWSIYVTLDNAVLDVSPFIILLM
jgi:hypothetical protein